MVLYCRYFRTCLVDARPRPSNLTPASFFIAEETKPFKEREFPYAAYRVTDGRHTPLTIAEFFFSRHFHASFYSQHHSHYSAFMTPLSGRTIP